MPHLLGFALPNAKWEYFCRECSQLRLYAKDGEHPTSCGNCGSEDIVAGAIGTLDKEALKNGNTGR